MERPTSLELLLSAMASIYSSDANDYEYYDGWRRRPKVYECNVDVMYSILSLGLPRDVGSWYRQQATGYTSLLRVHDFDGSFSMHTHYCY